MTGATSTNSLAELQPNDTVLGAGVGVGNSLELTADVMTGATALAGLLLVYMGSIATGYSGFEATEQRAVRAPFLLRIWFGFGGVLLSISAALLALIGKWLHNECIASASIVLLILALLWGIVTAFLTAREVK